MVTENKFSLIVKLFLLDAAGLTSLGFGIAKLQVNVDFLPEALRFPFYGWAFVVAGLLMMLPTAVHLFQFLREKPV